MIAGRMKYKLALLMPSTIENDFGEAKTTYEQTRIVNAERVKNNGRRSEEVMLSLISETRTPSMKIGECSN